MPTICAIQHSPSENLGLIGDVLKQAGISFRYVRPFRGERIPRRLHPYAGLVVLGGPMGVYEQRRYPFLRAELRLIEDALREEKPILGVCLGSQLLAAALGAEVAPGKQKEIGWQRVSLAAAAKSDPLWKRVPRSFTGFHWHGDIFDLPRSAVSLARSNLTQCQAFRYGPRAYGILFHLEVAAKIIGGMVKAFRSEVEEAGLAGEEILAGVPRHLPPLQKIGQTVFERWAALVKP